MVTSAFKMLSIVVPVYNESLYLEEVLRKVIQQPLPGGLEREVIVVNDASTDGSWQVMKSLPIKFPETRDRKSVV